MKFKKLLEYLKKEKVVSIKDFIIIIVGYGFLINYTLWALFDVSFHYFKFFGWGILYYFVTQEFVRWIRRIIARR